MQFSWTLVTAKLFRSWTCPREEYKLRVAHGYAVAFALRLPKSLGGAVAGRSLVSAYWKERAKGCCRALLHMLRTMSFTRTSADIHVLHVLSIYTAQFPAESSSSLGGGLVLPHIVHSHMDYQSVGTVSQKIRKQRRSGDLQDHVRKSS